jgi:glycine cleavage system aminomethyltransferase T
VLPAALPGGEAAGPQAWWPQAGADRAAGRPIGQTCIYLDAAATNSDCHGSEAVYARDQVVGSVTSGSWAPSLDRSLAFAYVEAEAAKAGAILEVMVLGERRAAYDPLSTRPRAQLEK